MLTLYYGQENDNYKEEEGDVKDDSIDLIFIAGWVFDFITDTPSGTYPDIHVEHIALEKRGMASLPGGPLPIFILNTPKIISLVPNLHCGNDEHLCLLHHLFLFQYL